MVSVGIRIFWRDRSQLVRDVDRYSDFYAVCFLATIPAKALGCIGDSRILLAASSWQRDAWHLVSGFREGINEGFRILTGY